jgi:glutamate carboxypeptidase
MLPFGAADIDMDDYLATLRQWVELESPSDVPEAVDAMMDLAERSAVLAGLAVERIPGRDGRGATLVIRHGRPDPAGVLLLAHLDTVHPVGSLRSMPWRRDGDRLYGPGIYDMKSGALMALRALELVARRGAPGPAVTLILSPDEETGGETSRAIIEREARRSCAPLGGARARAGGKVVIARKGAAIFRIQVHGRSSHAGVRPWDGRSAIRAAAALVLELEAMNDEQAGVSIVVGRIAGGTAHNVVPALCTLEVDVRIPSAELVGPVIDRIQALGATAPEGIRLEIEGGLNCPPYSQSAAAKGLFGVAREVARQLGYALEGVATGGSSDGNFAAALGCPTLDGLGADGAGAHAAHEHILVSSVAPRLAMLANLLVTLSPERLAAAGETPA